MENWIYESKTNTIIDDVSTNLIKLIYECISNYGIRYSTKFYRFSIPRLEMKGMYDLLCKFGEIELFLNDVDVYVTSNMKKYKTFHILKQEEENNKEFWSIIIYSYDFETLEEENNKIKGLIDNLLTKE